MNRRHRRLLAAFALFILGCADDGQSTPGGGGAGAGEDGGSSNDGGAALGGGGARADGGGGAGGEGGVYIPPDNVPDYLDILPPGQDGSLNGVETVAAQAGTYPPHVTDQLAMYHDLAKFTPGLAEEDLGIHYKDATHGIGSREVEREYSPIEGATVRRDAAFGVPHVVADTRYAAMFAMGYTGAEDRLFLMDVLRHVGRARLSEFLGASDSNQQMDRDQLAIAPYREADLTAQLAALGADDEGQAVLADLQAYADGVNAYINQALLDVTKLPGDYAAVQQLPLPWKLEDAVAIASLIGGKLGKGGGHELANHCGIQQLGQSLGSAAAARDVFDDFHFADDPDAPVTAPGTFPYMTIPASAPAAAHPNIDCSTLVAVGGGSLLPGLGGLGDLGLGGLLGNSMSNAILVSADRARAGRPIAVFGPQTGYFMPQLLVEKDVDAPGIRARGAAFAGIDMWVQLGHGDGYAWSATSSGADNIDQWVLELCEPGLGILNINSMGYKRNGVCEPIETYQHVQIAKPSLGGIGLEIILSWRVERTEHYGAVVARGRTTDGKFIAVATQRSTYGRELESARGFYRLNDPEYMAAGYEMFRQAVGEIEYSFNWFYIDDEDIGYQHGCRCPERSPTIDPYRPAWGNGSYDWSGYLSVDEQPHTLNPTSGSIVSWNNKQADGFTANDGNFSFGPTYRSDMLQIGVDAALAEGDVVRAQIVDAMQEGATVDLRGQEVLPWVLEVMGDAAPSEVDARAEAMLGVLATWIEGGAHRRDKDGDGAYDEAVAAAIVDAWWPRLCHGVFDETSGGAIAALGIEIDDHERTNHTGSAFQSGLYSHVLRDMLQVLGEDVTAPASRTYCGGGDEDACREVLWASLSQAAADLEVAFGSANVADWKRAMDYEDVRYSALGVSSVPAQPWTNRPTFQQVVQLNGITP